MQTTDCETAIELLLANWEDPDSHRTEVDAAIAHIKQCPHCEDRVGHLVRALAADREDRLTCQECEELLPSYVQAETEGRAGEARWRSVAFHIETCPHCSEAHSGLVELVELAYGEQGEEPSRYPVPDLSFLRPDWHQVALDYGRAWLERETGRWRRLALSLPTLGMVPQRAPALAGLMDDSAATPSSAQRTVAPTDANFEIKLVVEPDTMAGKGLYRLDVALTLYDRFGDFSGVQITLSWNGAVHTQETDVLGKVTFTGLPGDQLPSMSLTVTLPD